jgi:hypothetical protein
MKSQDVVPSPSRKRKLDAMEFRSAVQTNEEEAAVFKGCGTDLGKKSTQFKK